MSADIATIDRVRNLIEGGKTRTEVAELLGLSSARILLIMRGHNIRERKPQAIRVPSPPLHRLMGGR